MSVVQIDKVWGLRLPHNQFKVLMALADRAHDDGSHCFPSVALLVWMTEYGDRQVRRLLGELRNQGLIEAVAFSQGGHRPTEYQLHLDRGEQKARWESPWRRNRSGESPLTGESSPPLSGGAEPPDTVKTEAPDTACADEPSLTVIEPSEEPSTRAWWLDTLRGIDGWETKGEPHIDTLLAWVIEKGWETEQLEGSAIGLAATSEKTLKGYRDMAAAFQRRLNQGYDNPGHGDNGRGARTVSPVPGGKESGSASGWDNRGGTDQSST